MLIRQPRRKAPEWSNYASRVHAMALRNCQVCTGHSLIALRTCAEDRSATTDDVNSTSIRSKAFSAPLVAQFARLPAPCESLPTDH
jgi:hypothetical protein